LCDFTPAIENGVVYGAFGKRFFQFSPFEGLRKLSSLNDVTLQCLIIHSTSIEIVLVSAHFVTVVKSGARMSVHFEAFYGFNPDPQPSADSFIRAPFTA
jgi:hypothetical protein